MKRACIAALALLALAPAAEASWPRVDRAREVALAWWGETPECGQPRTMRSETADIADPRYFYNMAELPPRWIGVGDPIFCIIHLRRSWLATRPSWSYFCRVYIHEYGHVLGRSHSDDPHSMMHSPVLRTPRVCR